VKFYATLPPGLEDVAAKEIVELGGKVEEIRHGKGRIFFSGEKSMIPAINHLSRTLERLNLLLLRCSVESLDDIYREVRGLDFSFIRGSFAVRSLRVGEHDFRSLDIARVAGQAVIDSFMESHGERLRVNLSDPDVILRVELVENELFVGVDTTGDDAMHKRWWRVYNHPAHLNAAIACGMLRLAEWNEHERLIDPMCGSGTIPIEAALMARRVPNKREFAYRKFCSKKFEWEERDVRLRLFGIERFRKHLEGALKNAENAGVLDTITFIQGDALKMTGEYEVIITNPPYGLRIYRKGAIERLYRNFIIAAKRCMNQDSRLAVITSEYKILASAAEDAGLQCTHERFVRYGGLLTKIMVFKL